MEKSQDTKSSDRPAKKDRSDPLPLADRRRLMRPQTKPAKPDQVYTDWASI